MAANADVAPELGAFHDNWFVKAEEEGRDVYGSPDDWSPVKTSGHFYRMDVLAKIDIGSVSDKVAVDFGSGPWGFACIFPKLREARRCIGIDVSAKALEIAARRDKDILAKTVYKTSDGDSIPLEDDSVDIFWGGEVIEHVRNPRLFVQEIARVCRDGAQVILSTPNREALYYLARNEDYAIGSEHVALMNYQEFNRVLQMYLHKLKITGYETSLAPELDHTTFPKHALALMQERAAVFPAAASGFIAQGRVSKALYVRNRRDFMLDEFLWNSERVKGGRDAEALALFGGIMGGSATHDAPFCFETRGRTVILLFWAHAWSGEAEIDVDGDIRPISLYSPHGGFRRIEFEFASNAKRKFEIRRTGRKPEASRFDQVIFYKAMSYFET